MIRAETSRDQLRQPAGTRQSSATDTAMLRDHPPQPGGGTATRTGTRENATPGPALDKTRSRVARQPLFTENLPDRTSLPDHASVTRRGEIGASIHLSRVSVALAPGLRLFSPREPITNRRPPP